MKDDKEALISHFQDLCAQMSEHLKLLRDYGTTPNNSWLASSELSKISQLVAAIESTIAKIKLCDQ